MTTTATEKLLLIGQPALCRLITDHLILRQVKEPLDPQLLTSLAHNILEMASQAERNQLREQRNTQ